MGTCTNSTNSRIVVRSSETGGPFGTITIKPGPVAPGRIAAVRTPDSSLMLRRIYYFRERGLELVRLESLTRDKASKRYALGKVKVEGEVVCVVKVGERCEECDAAQRRQRRRGRGR